MRWNRGIRFSQRFHFWMPRSCIIDNWSVALESGGSIRTRGDPTEAVQISWIDHRLPLVSNSSSDNGKGSGLWRVILG